MQTAITITYSDRAHAGMYVVGGPPSANGVSVADLIGIKVALEMRDFKCDLINLARIDGAHPAVLLIIRGGITRILAPLGKSAIDMYVEQAGLDHDKKALMCGRVVSKRARHNLCFADTAHEPNYEIGRGRIIPWSAVPLTDHIRRFMVGLHPSFADLVAEGNYYYDPKKCGINFHGDIDHRIIIAAHLGVSIPLVFQWFHHTHPVSGRMPIDLQHGDIYIMSDKAVGHDWHQQNIMALRHAAGAPMFLGL